MESAHKWGGSHLPVFVSEKIGIVDIISIDEDHTIWMRVKA